MTTQTVNKNAGNFTKANSHYTDHLNWKRSGPEDRQYLTSNVKKYSGSTVVKWGAISLRETLSLESIYQQIKEASEVLSYADNWDEEGAVATNEETFNNAKSFLIDYAEYIKMQYQVVIKTPYIDILKDGSINIFWENGRSKFLIIFKKNNFSLAYFYAEKEGGVPLKGAVEIGKPVDPSIAVWMKEQLV